jgi:ubiquinone/menaquinone biosynthesis C-methylase UbiE
MGLFERFSKISRKRKLEVFFELVKNTQTIKVLDVGGEIGNTSLLFDLLPNKKNISVINISEEDIRAISKAYPEVDARVGDACKLPWPDNYFDIVYSNAVIEHVGDFEKQKKMASEVMRVGKKWFVTTPNRWYPFEFHMRLPFVTWLPFHGYLKAGSLICFNHVKRRYVFFQKIEHLRLMTANELRMCFPDSRIIEQRVTFLPETLIAIGEKV